MVAGPRRPPRRRRVGRAGAGLRRRLRPHPLPRVDPGRGARRRADGVRRPPAGQAAPHPGRLWRPGRRHRRPRRVAVGQGGGLLRVGDRHERRQRPGPGCVPRRAAAAGRTGGRPPLRRHSAVARAPDAPARAALRRPDVAVVRRLRPARRRAGAAVGPGTGSAPGHCEDRPRPAAVRGGRVGDLDGAAPPRRVPARQRRPAGRAVGARPPGAANGVPMGRGTTPPADGNGARSHGARWAASRPVLRRPGGRSVLGRLRGLGVHHAPQLRSGVRVGVGDQDEQLVARLEHVVGGRRQWAPVAQ